MKLSQHNHRNYGKSSFRLAQARQQSRCTCNSVASHLYSFLFDSNEAAGGGCRNDLAAPDPPKNTNLPESSQLFALVKESSYRNPRLESYPLQTATKRRLNDKIGYHQKIAIQISRTWSWKNDRSNTRRASHGKPPVGLCLRVNTLCTSYPRFYRCRFVCCKIPQPSCKLPLFHGSLASEVCT